MGRSRHCHPRKGVLRVELDDHGIHTAEWTKLQLVDHWRRYLAKPELYLRHALDHGAGP